MMCNFCDKPAKSKNMCGMHYMRLLRHGNVEFVNRVYGMDKVRTPEYKSYNNMKKRCFDKHSKMYYRYGARGITIDQRWLGQNGFENFLKDMGKRPSLKHSLDRINNELGYAPENCRWATYAQQAVNRSNNNPVPGVCYDKKRDMWEAYITINKVRHHKRFNRKNEAIAYRSSFVVA
jgi:hypothetical protein